MSWTIWHHCEVSLLLMLPNSRKQTLISVDLPPKNTLSTLNNQLNLDTVLKSIAIGGLYCNYWPETI